MPSSTSSARLERRPPAFRRNPDEKRERLLAAACDSFASLGFAAATTAEIAARAGVSEGILFHHFGSKRELFASAAAAYGRGLVGAMFGEAPGSRPVSAAESIRRAFTYVREHQALHRLFVMNDPPVDDLVQRGPRAEIVAALEAVFHRGAERGEMRAMDARIVAELLCALVGGALEACFVRGDGSAEEQYVRETVQCVAGALLPLAARTREPNPEA